MLTTMDPKASRYITLDAIPLVSSLESADDLAPLRHVFASALVSTAQSVNVHAKSHPRSTIYHGLAGISFLNYRLSQSTHPSLESHIAAFLSASHSQLYYALVNDTLKAPSSGDKVAFLDTSVGPATLVLLYQLSHLASSPTANPLFPNETCVDCARLLQRACEVALAESSEVPEEGCEVLYGRAGLLYALLCLQQALPDAGHSLFGPEPVQLLSIVRPLTGLPVSRLVQDIIARGKRGAAAFERELDRAELCPALMWSWHGKRYLGGAHGVAGILYILLHAPSEDIAPHWSAVTETVSYLLTLQTTDGNWPSKAVHRRMLARQDTSLVQWCHGAPGIIPLLTTYLALSRGADPRLLCPPELHARISSSLQRAATLTQSRGLLRKGPGLCHGVAGNAAALFAAADALQDEAGAECLAGGLRLLRGYLELIGSKDGRQQFVQPDRPQSLYGGRAGLCAVLLEALERIERIMDGRACMGERGVMRGFLGFGDLRL